MRQNKRGRNPASKIAGRIGAALLSLVMLIGVLPLTASAEGGSSGGNKGFDLTNAGVPQNYSDDMANPYGYAKGQKFLLSEENELLLYYSYLTDNNKKNQFTKWFDGFQPYIGGNPMPSMAGDEKGYFYSQGSYPNTMAFAYVDAIGFDPHGTGRKDHVAYVGYENGQQTIDGTDKYKGYVLWVMDTVSGNQYGPWRVSIGSCNWLTDKRPDLYAGSNFFNIVAGDFDGDGKDDLVISVVDDNQTFGLSQYHFDKNSGLRAIMTGDKNLLHPRAGDSAAKGNEAKHKLAMDLAVGDFNGDGIDDLAVISYLNLGSGLNKKDGDVHAGLPYLSVSYGSSGGGNLATGQRTSTYITTDSLDALNSSMYCATIAAGDIDNDGNDEIVAAGYKGKSEFSGSNVEFGSTSDQILYASFYAKDGSLSAIEYTELSPNEWTKADNGRTDAVGPKLVIAAVASEGSANPESIFISGDMYRCDDGSNKLNTGSRKPLDYFKNRDGNAKGESVGKSYLASVAVGNFQGGNVTHEQIAYVVGLQTSSSSHKYSFSVHVSGLNYPSQEDYYNYQGDYIYYNQSFSLKDRPNCVIVAIDRDNDGIMASYKGSGYAWSDPQVRAILQASPYFSELNDNVNGLEYLYDSPETTYATSLSYSYSTSSSDSVSFGVGFAGSIEAGSVSADMKLGFASEWTKTFTKSLEVEITDSFEAGAYDAVVLCRTPVFLYNYDVSYLEEGGHPASGVMEIAVPKAPVYTQLTIEEYNEFAAYYNNLLLQSADGKDVTDALLQPVADNLYLGQEGNPFGYYRDDASGVLKNLKTYGLLKNLTTSAGSNSSEYSYTESEESSVEISHGFSFELCIMGGFGVGGASAKAGGYTSLEYMKGHSVSKSNGVGTTIGGKVMGLNGVDMRADGLDPNAWNFNWKLATWDSNLKTGSGDDAKSVPVIGYVLSDIKAPAMPVENLKMQFTRSSENAELYFDLSWDCGDIADSGRSPAAGYFVYLYDNATDSYRLIDTINDPQITTYRYQNFYDGRDFYQFKVTAYCEATMTATSLESAPRDATYYMSSSGSAILKIEKTGTDGLVDTYTIHFIDGTTQTFTVTNGNGIVSVTPVSFDPTTGTSTYQITFADGSSTTFTVTNGEKGEKGNQGDDGRDGVGIDRIEKVRSEGITDYYAIFLTNGTSYIFTVTNGVDGVNGEDGKDGIDGQDGKDGIDGKDGKDGENGKDGVDGKDGKDGIGIVGIRIDENGDFIFTLSDGSEINAGSTPTDKEQEKQLSEAQAKIEALQEEAQKQSANRTVAVCGLTLAGTSLLWQATKLIFSLIRAKRKF